MSYIDRFLSKLMPAGNPPGDSPPRAPTPEVVPGTLYHLPDANADQQRLQNGSLKRSGPATVGLGHDWGGMPQSRMEMRVEAQSSFLYTNVSGAITLDIRIANVFRLQINGDTTVYVSSVNFPRPYQTKAGCGIDVAFTILIENPGGHTVSVPCDWQAPYAGEQAAVLTSKYIELGMAVNMTPGQSNITRCFPAIRADPYATS